MNSSISLITQLNQLVEKKYKTIVGLMSGTSLDGLDIALCSISGKGRNTSVELMAFKTVSYPGSFRQQLKKIVSTETVQLQDVCLLHSYIGDYFGELILEALQEWDVNPGGVDCIASHGQTIYHAPFSKHHQKKFGNTTLQIGDGDHIAQKTGILTISDFRQKHTAAGGQGAPLAALIDELLFRHDEEYRLLLNIGGIANFTYLPPADSGPEVITTDTGPGNTLLDALIRQRLGQRYDEDGKMAANGKVNDKLLKKLKNNSFFDQPLPKTTGPELFNLSYLEWAQHQTNTSDLSARDLLATLSRLTADTISNSIRDVHQNNAPLAVYISGGGIHNTFVIDSLTSSLNRYTIQSFEKIGFNPDAKEAACFAVLANERLSGEGFQINTDTGKKKINLGKISLPD